MEQPLDALKLALRVLSAISERQAPEAHDVQELRRLAPALGDGPLDELACDVIQQALRRRAEVRARIVRAD
jgi:hypothetical protein